MKLLIACVSIIACVASEEKSAENPREASHAGYRLRGYGYPVYSYPAAYSQPLSYYGPAYEAPLYAGYSNDFYPAYGSYWGYGRYASEETDKLKEGAAGAADKLKATAHDVKDKGEGTAKNAKDKVEGAAKDAKDKVTGAAKDAKENVEAAGKKAEDK